MMNDDMALLREFAASQSGRAFETLVARHIHLVHSAALRQVRDPHLAEEITQAVFIILARKAGALGEKTILSGWLYRTAHYASADALKIQRRRQRREQEAHMQSMLEGSPTETAWREFSPLLDEAMAKLRQTDRDAVVLRYFENKSLREVGGALGLQERAAQKRIARALEKLRTFFANRGVALSAAAIAGAVSANSVQAVPVALAKSVTAVAIAKGAAASGSTLTLIKGALKLMAWTKAQTAIVIGAGVLLAVGTTTVTVKEMQERKTYEWQVKNFNFTEILEKVKPQVKILPTKYPGYIQTASESSVKGEDARHLGIGAHPATVIQMAFQFPFGYRIVFPANLPQGRYDYIANLRQGSSTALQREIKSKFGLTGRLETVETNVLFLKVKYPNSPGLKSGTMKTNVMFLKDGQPNLPVLQSSEPKIPLTHVGIDGISDKNVSMSTLAGQLEDFVFRIPVIDQTGLTGFYDFNLSWKYSNPEGVKSVLADQLGLELVSGRAAIEMLVVTKSN